MTHTKVPRSEQDMTGYLMLIDEMDREFAALQAKCAVYEKALIEIRDDGPCTCDAFTLASKALDKFK